MAEALETLALRPMLTERAPEELLNERLNAGQDPWTRLRPTAWALLRHRNSKVCRSASPCLPNRGPGSIYLEAPQA